MFYERAIRCPTNLGGTNFRFYVRSELPLLRIVKSRIHLYFPSRVASSRDSFKNVSRGSQKTLEFTSLAVIYRIQLRKSFIFDCRLIVYLTGILLKKLLWIFWSFETEIVDFFISRIYFNFFLNQGGQLKTRRKGLLSESVLGVSWFNRFYWSRLLVIQAKTTKIVLVRNRCQKSVWHRFKKKFNGAALS